MLDQSRVDARVETLRSNIDLNRAVSRLQRYLQKLEIYMRGEARNAIGAGQALSLVGDDLRFSLHLASEDRFLSTSMRASVSFLIADLVVRQRGTTVKIGSNYSNNSILGRHVPMWQAAGWHRIAEHFATDVWTDYRAEKAEIVDTLFGNPNRGAWINEHSNPYSVHKDAWFTTMTTVPEDLWKQHGYDPDMDSMGAHWMLAQVWDDPDPAKARNALQAVREHNLGTTFIKDEPEGSRVYLVDEFLLLDDYDVRSVNMRRLALGLEAVDVERYLPDPLPLEVLPFAKDDVFYPAYVRMCQEIGVEPYAPQDSVDVRLDPETLQVRRL